MRQTKSLKANEQNTPKQDKETKPVKKREITKDNIVEGISRLVPNQVFRNYRELCEFLDIKIRNGKSKEAQLAELKRYVKLARDGYGYIVKEIYDIPRDEKKDPRSIYKNHIKFLLLQGLSEIFRNNKVTENDYFVLIYPEKELLYNLSMINENFYPYLVWDYISDTDLDEAALDRAYKKLDREEKNFYYKIKQKLRNYLFTALDSLMNSYFIKWSLEYLLTNSRGYERTLTDEEAAWYNEKVSEAIESFNGFNGPRPGKREAKNLYDVILNKDIEEFYEKLDETLSTRFGPHAKITRVYKIVTTATTMKIAKKTLKDYDKSIREATDLNDKITANLINTVLFANNKGEVYLTPRGKAEFINDAIALEEEEIPRHVDYLYSGDGCKKGIESKDSNGRIYFMLTCLEELGELIEI